MLDMSDEEFLRYCDGMADTPRCGFVPQNLERLTRLAGRDVEADFWAKEPNCIVDADRDVIRRIVGQARTRAAISKPTGPGS